MNPRKMAWPVALVVALAVIVGCRNSDAEARARVEAINMLSSICLDVLIVTSETDQAPPVELEGLIQWLAEHGTDYSERRIRDPWGHPVVIVAESGRFVGIGSSGPDGRWKQGAGDDIIITLEEVMERKDTLGTFRRGPSVRPHNAYR